MKVAEGQPSRPLTAIVFFGATFGRSRLSPTGGEPARYRIVGPDETDARAGWISIDSPLARAALRKRVDDEFEVLLPAGPARYVVLAVAYPLPV